MLHFLLSIPRQDGAGMQNVPVNSHQRHRRHEGITANMLFPFALRFDKCR